MAPKKVTTGNAAEKPERPPVGAASARSRSPPARRVTSKAKAAAPSPELFGPARVFAAELPAEEDRVAKREVKLEESGRRTEVEAVPGATGVDTVPATVPATAPATAPATFEAAPQGEMQRMMSNLKVQAKNGNPAPLAKYNALETVQEKRKYYYECWLTANPKTTDSGGVRSRKSEKLDEAVVKDHGWVDKEYVAEKLCLKGWKVDEEMHIKLKFQLSQMQSRPHPAKHLLKEDMDAFQYHFVEKKDKETQRNKRSFELLQQTSMSMEEHSEALTTWDAGAGGNSTAALPDASRKKRTPSRSPTQEPTPEWLSTFKKEGANNLASLKRSMTCLLSNAETLVKTCEDNPALFKDNQLLQAYLATVRTQVQSLRAAEQKAATFELKHGQSPKTQTEATTMLPKFKAAIEEAKAVKTAFSSSTNSMQTALRAKLAQLTRTEP